MDKKRFITGLGLGMIAGGAVGLMMAPSDRRSDAKKTLDRAMKSVGGVMRDVSDLILR